MLRERANVTNVTKLMDIEKKLTQELVSTWLEFEEDEFNIESFRRKHNIEADSVVFRVSLHRFVEAGKLKRIKRGWYRKVREIEPIVWWESKETLPIPIIWPYGVEDMSSFGFDETVEIFPGDAIVIAGRSNWGKTCFALNFLVNNLKLFEGATMMVNEYKPQRFKNRMSKFTWVDFWNESKPKFELLPITENHVDYIKANYLNIIDWLNITGDFWIVAKVIEEIQMQLRSGIALVVLQKTGGKEYGVGGDWGTFFPSFYATIDPPGVLTVTKVKSAPMGAIKPDGKKLAFDIVDAGSKFHRIREVKTCPKCKGRGYNYDKECEVCHKTGYVE